MSIDLAEHELAGQCREAPARAHTKRIRPN
jgi:hypothetical protein